MRPAWEILLIFMSRFRPRIPNKSIELHPACVDSLAVINEYGVQKSVFPVSETLGRISADLKADREEILAKVVVGDMTVEEGMAKYKENAEMLNVQKVVDELNGK